MEQNVYVHGYIMITEINITNKPLPLSEYSEEYWKNYKKTNNSSFYGVFYKYILQYTEKISVYINIMEKAPQPIS